MTIASNVKQCLASLKGIEAQLSTLALNAQDEKAQQLFHEKMIEVGKIKQNVQLRVYEIEREERQYRNN